MTTDLLTIKQCCELLHVSRPTFDRLRQTHSLKEYPIGKRVRFSKQEIEEKILLSGEKTTPINALSHDDFEFERLWPKNTPIDLDRLSLMDAFSASALLCFVFNKVQRGEVVEITASSDEKGSYLKGLDFFNVLTRLGKGTVKVNPILTNAPPSIHPEIILPISIIGFKGAQRRYTEEIKVELKKQGFSEDFGHYMAWMIGELADNAHTHAQSNGQCFISIERLAGRAHSFLHINILDCGKGIQTTLKQNPKYSHLSDEKAFLMAFKSKVSSWGDEHERGKGLNDILKIAFECNSHFRVESNDIAYTFFCQDNKANIKKIHPAMTESGTRFSITLIDNHFKTVTRNDVNQFIDQYLEKL